MTSITWKNELHSIMFAITPTLLSIRIIIDFGPYIDRYNGFTDTQWFVVEPHNMMHPDWLWNQLRCQ